MADASSFDQWRKDVFFSAAEEVQESADALESVYRMWIRYRSDGSEPEISDELLRELRTALGTAKWQLEEFEKSVCPTRGDSAAEDNSINRRKEFVAAIGSKVSDIEKALGDSLVEDGKQPFRWVQLNEEERDDLAAFLSAAPPTLEKTKDKRALRGFKETVVLNKNSKYVIEVAAEEPLKNIAQVVVLDEQKRSSSPDIGSWKIAIAEDEDANRKVAESTSGAPARASNLPRFLRSIGYAVKSKLFRSSFSKAKSGEHHPLRQGLPTYLDLKGITQFAQGINGLKERSRNCFQNCNEDSKVSNVQHLVGKASGLQRHIQGSQYYIQFGRSLQITIVLLLTIILIGPFVLNST